MKTLKLHHNGFSNSSRTTLGTMETTSSCCFDRFVCVCDGVCHCSSHCCHRADCANILNILTDK